jgi:LmbE family N-acetylglucosaminyl deacetylase
VPTLGSRFYAPQLWLCLVLCLFQEAPAAADIGNDRYSFVPTASRQRGITLERTEHGARLSLTSAEVGDADTLLLGIRVAADGDTPMLRARIGTTAIEQYLDANAHGLRWLNLTSLRKAIGKVSTLELEAQHLTITSQQANLRSFENHLPFERGILVLAPHPDDAEIAAFGLYASHAAQARIVTITSGNAGSPTYRAHFDSEGPDHYQFKGVLRVIDSITVPWQGGVPPEHCYNLGYFDARLETMHAQKGAAISEVYSENRDVAPYRRANLGTLLPSASRLNSWQNLVADLAQLLAVLEPAVVVLPHPLLDSHPDHQFVAVAAAEAAQQHAKPITFLLYTNHAGNNLYPYGPAGSVTSLPPWNSADLPVQGLYALPVDRALQRRKLFALESMHDLRLSPDEQAHCSTRPPTIDSPRNESMDYFRRAPRSEELFFVFDRAGLTALVQRFLGARKEAP